MKRVIILPALLLAACTTYNKTANGPSSYIPISKGVTFSNYKRLRSDYVKVKKETAPVNAVAHNAIVPAEPTISPIATHVNNVDQEQSSNVMVQRYLQPGETEHVVTTPTVTKSSGNQRYTIKKGGTYRSGIASWLWQDGVDLIAWDQSLNSYLDTAAASAFDVNAANTKEAISLLASKNPTPFYFGKTTLETGQVVAAVHSFSKPQIHLTSGRTLQEAITALAVDYGWKFVPDSQWLVTDDFEFPTNYPVVTELGDIETALLQILDGFPVRAQVLHSTKQIFIVEERENDE